MGVFLREPSATIRGQNFLKMGALLLIVSTFLILVGNRQVSLVQTPFRNLYWLDIVYFSGAFLGFLGVIASGSIKRLHLLIFVPLVVYCVILAIELARTSSLNLGFAMRDASLFFFLCTIPIASLCIASIRESAILWMLRIAALVTAFISIAATTGLLSLDEMLARGDLVAASLGIGVIAWGQWNDSVEINALRGSIPTQLLLLGVGFSVVGSRSGWLALAASLVLATFRTSGPKLKVVLGAGGFVVAFLCLGLQIGVLGLTGSTPKHEDATFTQNRDGLTFSTNTFQERVERPGTTLARVSTWQVLLQGMTRDGTLAFGGQGGGDYLYELCTGIKRATSSTPSETEPKCPVDSATPGPPLRDPHNLLFNTLLYHGIIGVLLLVVTLASALWQGRRESYFSLASGSILIFLIVGISSVVSASYAYLPISFFAAWLLVPQRN